MKNMLINCYYDNMSVEQAKTFALSCYGKLPTEKQIASVKSQILKLTGLVWA